MLCTLVAALAISQDQPQKTVLPNGAVVYVERMDSPGFTLHLFVSTMGAKEQSPGLRHLLEHLVGKGNGLDAKLESRGLTLTAETLRDGVRFEIEGNANSAAVAIEALKELLAPRTLTQEEIDKEVRIVSQERPVRSNASRLATGLWKQAFDEPDMMGTDEEIAKATPDSLKQLFTSMWRPECLTIAIVGGIDVVQSERAIIEIVRPLQSQGAVNRTARTAKEQRGEGIVPGATGSGRAVAVGPMSRAESLAVVAAALAIANETPGTQVVYTPSSIGGLVCIVHPNREGFLDTDRLVTNEGARLYPSGLAAVRLWVATADGLPREKARMYGQQLSAEPYFRMEDLKNRAAVVSQAEFVAALQKFRTGACVRVGGVR